MNGFEPRLIELAGYINSQMPAFTITRLADALNQRGKCLKKSKILGLGVAYKRDTSDVRESPALEVLEGLHEKGALVSYSDPFVPSLKLNGRLLESVRLSPEILQSMDCVIVLTDHPAFDYKLIAAHSHLILDCRNALENFPCRDLICL